MKGIVIQEFGDYLERMAKSLGSLVHDTYVKVGFLGGEGPAPGPGEPVDVVKLGLIHEFGAPRASIPERSFIRGAFNANRAEYHSMLAALAKAIFEEKMTVQRALGLMGQKMVADIQAYVRAGTNLEPLKPATVERKKAKGRKKMGRREGPVAMPIPLIDTGRLLGAVSYQVVINGRPVGGVRH